MLPERCAAAFRKGLSEAGYVDGQKSPSSTIGWKAITSARRRSWPTLVRRRVAVIATPGEPSFARRQGRNRDDPDCIRC